MKICNLKKFVGSVVVLFAGFLSCGESPPSFMADSLEDTESFPDAVSDSGGSSHEDSSDDFDGEVHSDTNPDTDMFSDTNPDTDMFSDTNPDTDMFSDDNTDANSDTNTDSDKGTDSEADEDCDTAIPWWDGTWLSRDHIAITNTGDPVAAGYTVAYTFDHAAMVAEGSSLANGNDIRLIYWDGTSFAELDRIIAPESKWNNIVTTILFAVPDNIHTDESTSTYALYYNNAAAGRAPSDVSNILSYEAGWAMQVGANPAQSLGCARQAGKFYYLQLRQLSTTSWDYEIHIIDTTNDIYAMGRVIITNNDALYSPTGVIFDQTFGNYGRLEEAGTHTLSPLVIRSRDFTVSIETGEFSKSRQYFGCQQIIYPGVGNGGNQTDITVFDYTRQPPAAPTVSASLVCKEQ